MTDDERRSGTATLIPGPTPDVSPPPDAPPDEAQAAKANKKKSKKDDDDEYEVEFNTPFGKLEFEFEPTSSKERKDKRKREEAAASAAKAAAKAEQQARKRALKGGDAPSKGSRGSTLLIVLLVFGLISAAIAVAIWLFAKPGAEDLDALPDDFRNPELEPAAGEPQSFTERARSRIRSAIRAGRRASRETQEEQERRFRDMTTGSA